MRKLFKNWLKPRWPLWAARFLKFWNGLVRKRIVGFERTRDYANVVFAHWHGDEIALITLFPGYRVTVLVSHSRDGEAMARAATWLGYNVTRGSSTRGAVGGLVALIRSVREGHPAVLAVDGPQGPRGVCKPGIVRLAQKTDVPVFPVGVAVSRRYVFKKTWNQVYLPLPFARQAVVFGQPVFFPRKTAEGDMDRFCRQMEAALNGAQDEARRILDEW